MITGWPWTAEGVSDTSMECSTASWPFAAGRGDGPDGASVGIQGVRVSEAPTGRPHGLPVGSPPTGAFEVRNDIHTA